MAVTHLQVATSAGLPASSLTSEEIDQINWWLKVAQTKIRLHFLKRHVPFADLDADVVDIVVVEAVARKVSNPLGKQNERIDDYSYGLNADEATSQIRITDEEWDLLTPVDNSERGAFTIRTDLGARTHRHTGWWPR